MPYATEQETFWAGDFGTAYVQRNRGEKLAAANLALFSRALQRASPVTTCIEFGANIGLNLTALKLLFPGQEQHAVEINSAAAKELANVVPEDHIILGSMLNLKLKRTWDLVLAKGLLIHTDPIALPRAYEVLTNATGRYLLICEYYSPTPATVPYRGHYDRLFKRDFAGEIIDRYPTFRLLDYGFTYHRDPNFPQDDSTWFLLEKQHASTGRDQ